MNRHQVNTMNFKEKRKLSNRKLNNKLQGLKGNIQSSMIKLMKSFPYSEITVTMIASNAYINRKTFYAYYSNKEELLFSMLYDMFDDLFSCFMYKKEVPCDIVDEGKLREDVENFWKKVSYYEESILALITDETSGFSISIADQVVLNHCKEIGFFDETGDTIYWKFYLEIIRSFFMSIIGAWIDSEKISLDEAVDVLVKIMKHSCADMLYYVKPMKK